MRLARILAPVSPLVLLALFCVPWLVLVVFPRWPTPVFVTSSVGFGSVLLLPTAMFLGHGRSTSTALP
jgi:hypothetical protein